MQKRHAPPTRERLETLTSTCRKAGVSVTPQRLAIYGALCESMDHPSPEVLHGRLRASMPTLSLATVYKTLHLFAELGVAREVSVAGDNSRRFDANCDRHHHLVCEECHDVVDLYDTMLDQVAIPKRLEGFQPRAVHVQIVGLCAGCGGAARR